MLTLRNAVMELVLSDDARGVSLTHRATGVTWVLDPATSLADGSGRDDVAFGSNRVRFGENQIDPTTPPPVEFERGSVQSEGETAAVVTRIGPAGQLALRYELVADGCRVTVLSGRTTVTSCSLPGAFHPAGLKTLPVVLPKNQGIWHKGTGAPFSFTMSRNGHAGWSLPFFAAIGPQEALLTILEDEQDARIWFERNADGRMIVAAVQDPTLTRMGYDRSVLLRFTAPDLTAVCQSYRRHVQDHGGLVTWEEKIAARPQLEKLFGALMCFIGYCQDSDLDYGASFRALRKQGFDRAFVYPLCIGNLREGFLMGGRPPIDIRAQLALLSELGYLTAGWMWVEDLPSTDQVSRLRHNAAGQATLSWQIDEVKWYHGCTVSQVAVSNQIQDERMTGFTAQHFDVTASRMNLECHHPDHPLDRRDDARWRLKVLNTALRRGCVVSSEGYWGYAAAQGACDIGSVKIPSPVHTDWFTVPITSLVYHDAMIHDWWEVDNYNNPHHHHQFDRDKIYFPIDGGGKQAMQATQDALGGWPPNVFPFGSQYAYVGGKGPATELYRYNLASPEVVEALALAKPIAALHRRIGKLACQRHELLAANGSVQATIFADGTRVVANYANEPREVAGVGVVPPRGWKTQAL